MSAAQAPRLESLIADKICSLGYVSKVGYRDNGREVTILVVHVDNPDKYGAMFREIGDRGTEIEDEMRDRAIIALPIQDGPDLPRGLLGDCKVVHAREAVR